jgi:hypothetical protein
VNHRSVGLEDHSGVRVEVGVAMDAVGISLGQGAVSERRLNYDGSFLGHSDSRGSDSFFAPTLSTHGASRVSIKSIFGCSGRSKDVFMLRNELSRCCRIQRLQHELTLA